VSLTQTNGGLALRVRDDGRGLRRGGGSAPPEGFGMTSMRERAATLGGRMTVRERSTGGTEVEVLLP
jgi:signal transduction histidine kinase